MIKIIWQMLMTRHIVTGVLASNLAVQHILLHSHILFIIYSKFYSKFAKAHSHINPIQKMKTYLIKNRSNIKSVFSIQQQTD